MCVKLWRLSRRLPRVARVVWMWDKELCSEEYGLEKLSGETPCRRRWPLYAKMAEKVNRKIKEREREIDSRDRGASAILHVMLCPWSICRKRTVQLTTKLKSWDLADRVILQWHVDGTQPVLCLVQQRSNHSSARPPVFPSIHYTIDIYLQQSMPTSTFWQLQVNVNAMHSHTILFSYHINHPLIKLLLARIVNDSAV